MRRQAKRSKRASASIVKGDAKTAVKDGVMSKAASSRYLARLKKLRKEIDEVDRELIRSLAWRFRVVQKIGRLKRGVGDSVVQKKRRAEIFRDRKERGEKMGLSPRFVQRVFELIQEEAVACQKKVLGGSKKKTRRRS